MSSSNSAVAGRHADRRLALSFGAVVALLMTVVLILWQNSSTKLSEEHEREAEAATISMLSTSIEKVSTSGKFHVRLLVDELAKQDRVLYVIVSDANGRISAHSDKSKNGKMVTAEERELIDEVLAADSPVIRHVKRDSESVHQLASVVRWGFNDNDRRVIFLGLSRNVSESRQSSTMWRQIRTMAEQLDGILKGSPLLIRIENEQGELLETSTAYKQETRDASEEELAGLKLAISNSHQAVSSDEATTWTNKNNDSFVFTSFSLGNTHDDKATQVCAVGLNTTKERAAEEALRDNEQQLRITLNSIADAVVTTDADCHIRSVNPVGLELCQGTLIEVVGRPVYEVFNTRSLQPSSRNKPTPASLMAVNIVRDLLIQNDGSERQIEWSSASMVDSRGRGVGFVLVFRDVTEKLRVEDELRQSQKEESIGRLAGGIAHDFNNMLGGVMGAAGLLQLEMSGPSDDLNSEECLEYIDLILASTKRAAELTGQLLAFSRKGTTQVEPVDVHSVIRENIALLQSSIDKRIEIRAELDADVTVVLGEISRIQNAILNLGINARDAIESAGVMTFSTKNVVLDALYCESSRFPLEPGSYLRVSVHDTGSGMSIEQQQQIFEPYYTTKALGKGTGLGLASVYGTVTGHNGSIEVFSNVGEGTVFHLFWPLLENETAKTPRMPAEVQKGKGTVLLVEDEEIILYTTARMLKSLGYRVITATDGRSAIDVLAEQSDIIDLVMTDMIMPKADGEAVLRFVQENAPTIPVIIASGYIQDHSIEALGAAGLAGFLPKPYDLEALASTISSALKA